MKKCPHCLSENVDQAKFCTACGANLQAVSTNTRETLSENPSPETNTTYFSNDTISQKPQELKTSPSGKKALFLIIIAAAVIATALICMLKLATIKSFLTEASHSQEVSSNSEQTDSNLVGDRRAITVKKSLPDPTVNLEEGGFDAFCDTWESADHNLRLRISSGSDGYLLTAYIVPWDLHTEIMSLGTGILNAPLQIKFDQNMSGSVTLQPFSSDGTLTVAYSFDRHFADPEKTLLTNTAQKCTRVAANAFPKAADFSKCLGWWMNDNDSPLYLQLAANDNGYNAQIFSYDYDINSAVLPMNETDDTLSAEFDMGNGIYGTLSLTADRSGTLSLENITIYNNDGAELLINRNDCELTKPRIYEAEDAFGEYFYGFCAAVTYGDPSYVADTMVYDSEIYKQQIAVAKELDEKGIIEDGISYEIKDTEILDKNHCKLISSEIIEVYYADGRSQQLRQSYQYILERVPDVGWKLTHME